MEWGQHNYVNPPFGSIVHQGKKKGPTAWARKAIAENAKGKAGELQALVDLPDSKIDTSDIPEVKDWSKAVRGKYLRLGNESARGMADEYEHARHCPVCGSRLDPRQDLRAPLHAWEQRGYERGRLEEAEWWREQSHEGARCSLQDCTQCTRVAEIRALAERGKRERIASMEQQPEAPRLGVPPRREELK